MRYEKHCSSFLVMIILFVYYLQFNSIEMQRGQKRQESEVSWNRFKKISAKLRRQVDMIAARRKQKFYEEDSEEEVVEESLQQARTIIYNRIDKAGSTTMIKTLERLAYRNNFFLIGQGTPNLRMLDRSQKKDLARVFCGNDHDIIYTRHLYFTNFSEFGCEIKYFNVVRDPVRRFVSRYNWYREVYHMKSGHFFKKQGKDMSANLTDCVLNSHPECQYQGELQTMLRFFRMDSQITFFCGEDIECLFLGNPEALRIAKENIQKHFIVVGLLEDLDKTHKVMECLMPEKMQQLGREHRRKELHVHSVHKFSQGLSEEAAVVMRERLSLEYELYNFVKDRLEIQYQECMKTQTWKGLV